MLRIESHSAYILHARSYRETSLILDLLTRDYGRLSAIAKAAKRGSQGRGILQPFIPLLISCSGRTELLTLKSYEAIQPGVQLIGRRLVSALYMNELLVKLLQTRDPYPELFKHYRDSLIELEKTTVEEEITLRLFEKNLLKALGYGLELSIDCESGQRVDPEKHYYLNPEKGPYLASTNNCFGSQTKTTLQPFKGKHLLAIQDEFFKDREVMQEAKRLMRQALNLQLGNKTIETRKIIGVKY